MIPFSADQMLISNGTTILPSVAGPVSTRTAEWYYLKESYTSERAGMVRHYQDRTYNMEPAMRNITP